MKTKITILGSGAMATACAVVLSDQPRASVSMWVRLPDHADEIRRERENRRLLPGIPIPAEIEITPDINEAVRGAEYILAAIPTKFLRDSLTLLAPALAEPLPVVSVIKGLENETFLRPSQIIEEVLGSRPTVVLGGPSHAEEIGRRLPASVVAASGDVVLAREVQQLFSTERFRVYTNPDLIGVELAGALKNVIAIAAGICDGLGFGDNAKSALLTRGIVEIQRFGAALGAEPATFNGLAGIGDLITTCYSPHGRNRLVGERLGQGQSLETILASMNAVAEGVNTTRSVMQLAEQRGLDLPIIAAVHSVLFAGTPALTATMDLLERPPGEE